MLNKDLNSDLKFNHDINFNKISIEKVSKCEDEETLKPSTINFNDSNESQTFEYQDIMKPLENEEVSSDSSSSGKNSKSLIPRLTDDIHLIESSSESSDELTDEKMDNLTIQLPSSLTLEKEFDFESIT